MVIGIKETGVRDKFQVKEFMLLIQDRSTKAASKNSLSTEKANKHSLMAMPTKANLGKDSRMDMGSIDQSME